MKSVDGFARVITDNEGKIIDVLDSYWNHNNLSHTIGDTEIIDMLYELNAKDAEVLVPLTYKHTEGKWIGADWSDPEELLIVSEEYVLQSGYKEKYKQEILEAWKDEFDWRYVDDMIEHYKSLYDEDIELEQEGKISFDNGSEIKLIPAKDSVRGKQREYVWGLDLAKE